MYKKDFEVHLNTFFDSNLSEILERNFNLQRKRFDFFQK